MPYFVVMARKEFGKQCLPLTQIKGSEQRAIELAVKIFRDGGMNRALVVDGKFKIVFKVDRNCKCRNCQYEIDGLLRCLDCKRVINTNGFKVEEYIK